MKNVAITAIRVVSAISKTTQCATAGFALRRAATESACTFSHSGPSHPRIYSGPSNIAKQPHVPSRCRAFHTSQILRRLKPYDGKEDQGLRFRDKDLSPRELFAVYNTNTSNPDLANRLLRVLHARRVDGTLDIEFDEEISEILEHAPELQESALLWLRARYPVDEDEAIESRFRREESPRVQEHPSALTERGQRLGLFKTQDASMSQEQREKVEENARLAQEEGRTKMGMVEKEEYVGPQSGSFYAELDPKDESNEYGRSRIDEIRAKNEAEAEEEEKKMDQEVEESMAVAQAKHQEKSRALEAKGQNALEVSDGGRGILGKAEPRPPNEFEKWIIRANRRAQSNLSLDSPEIAEQTNTTRILPSALFVLVGVGMCYVFAENWTPPLKKERWYPESSMAQATIGTIFAINTIVFLGWRFPPLVRLLNTYCAVVPAYPYVFSMLGNLFSQQTLKHFAFNMFSLYLFGPALHEQVGRGTFVAIYLSSGLVGGLASLSWFVLRGILTTSSMGASGCIWGILASYFWLFRDSTFSFIFIPQQWQESLNTNGLTLLGALLVLDVIMGVRKRGIDLMAHMSGAGVGIVMTWIWQQNHKITSRFDQVRKRWASS